MTIMLGIHANPRTLLSTRKLNCWKIHVHSSTSIVLHNPDGRAYRRCFMRAFLPEHAREAEAKEQALAHSVLQNWTVKLYR